jgi:hypothetical protein
MAAKAPGWRRGSSPEAAKRCGTSLRALRATTDPVTTALRQLFVDHSGHTMEVNQAIEKTSGYDI